MNNVHEILKLEQVIEELSYYYDDLYTKIPEDIKDAWNVESSKEFIGCVQNTAKELKSIMNNLEDVKTKLSTTNQATTLQ